jgi:hypothetical protein
LGRIANVALLATLIVGAATSVALSGGKEDLQEFLRIYPKFADSEIQQVERGSAVAKILDTPEKEEIIIFGAIKMAMPVKAFVDHIRDVEKLEDGETYIVVEKFSNPPVMADVQRLTLDEDDIEDLRDCKPGDCDIQLPAMEIQQFGNQIDWNSNDAVSQVNHLAQEKALEVLKRYQENGTRGLRDYRDKKDPLNIQKTYEDLLNRTDALPVRLPEFNDYLLNYPAVSLEGTDEFFYWEKVKFGLKPTIRGVHAIIYEAKDGDRSDWVIAFKQLYSTHYFLAALDLWFCLEDPDSGGFYLITLKGSRQHGLTGFKGSILRKVVVGRTRDSVEQALNYMKTNFER